MKHCAIVDSDNDDDDDGDGNKVDCDLWITL